MNLKAIKPSYGDFGRVHRGMILKDISKDRAAELIKGGAYVEASADDIKAHDDAQADLAARAKAREKAKRTSKQPAPAQLREDGPTIVEYVAAGYPASTYPPQGYAARSTPDEISAAVEAEKAKAAADAAAAEARGELEKLTNKQLQELATAEEIAVESDDNKASLVEKIIAGRAAKS